MSLVYGGCIILCTQNYQLFAITLALDTSIKVQLRLGSV